jgi:transcriptional regulator with XRE-family HTH domain
MPRTASDPELKAEFSAKIREILRKSSAQEIADVLGVKRQTVYNYRDGKNAPSPEVIRRAMEYWPGLSLKYRGSIWKLQGSEQQPRLVKKEPVQLGLWDAIEKLDSESVKIEILKKETSSVQLGVRIYFRKR